MKITKIKEDITSDIANSFKGSIAIDTEATGLLIPERDKLSSGIPFILKEHLLVSTLKS